MPKRRLTQCTPEALTEACARLGIVVPEAVLPALHTYLCLLLQYNTVMNLVGTRSWFDTLDLLVSDSFYLAPFVRQLALPAQPVCADAGAGAGLPGIPLRMLWQEGTYSLVEVRQKRALFMQTVLSRLTLPRTSVFHGRIEDFAAHRCSPLHLLLSRAFMPWREVLALARPLLDVRGFVVFLLLQPPPPALPEGWELCAQHAYTVRGTTRFFWAVSRKGE